MTARVLDDVDERILYALQSDAYRTTTTELGRRLGISSSTVRNRIAGLEDDGIITGYHASVDYERAGYPLHVLMICSAGVSERNSLARRARAVPGVVAVRELVTGEENVRLEAVGESNADLTRIATTLDDLGLRVHEEILIRNGHDQPFASFAAAGDDG